MLTTEKNIQFVKSDIINEIEKRVEDKILEPANAELLKKLINNAETTTEAIEIAKLGTIYKRTGFNFDTKCEKNDNTIKYFKKNTELSFETNPNGITHKLIIGDNYTALLNLLIEYKGKIDVIYIDPPYGKDSMGEFAQTNYENAITRDNLLSMLYNRLRLAKLLLSETGVIFCSIDDRNQAYVKCLFDEIFEEKNFVGTFIRRTINSGKHDSVEMAIYHEYLITFAKNISSVELNRKLKDENEIKKLYPLEDEYIKTRGRYYISQLDKGSIQYSDGLNYPITAPDGTEIWPGNGFDDKTRVFRWSKEKVKWGLENNYIVFKKQKDKWKVYAKSYEFRDNCDNEILPSNPYTSLDYISKEYSNFNATPQLQKIFNDENCFDFPKPVSFLKNVINFNPNKNSIILDFFAGSGTTGQAVLELNKEDNGHRTFILVQLNENLDNTLKEHPKNETVKKQIALCDKYKRPHYLSEITTERLRRVMTGKCFDGNSDFPWIKNNEALGDNLDVYDISEVANNECIDGKTPFDVIDETLYGKDKLNVSEKIQWVIDNFEITQKRLSDKD